MKHYSSGMSVRLAFSVAAHLEPEILIVDEVLSVGDLHFRNRCLGRMQDLRDEGRTVLFVSHDLTSVRQLCTARCCSTAAAWSTTAHRARSRAAYERMYQEGAENTTGAADRRHPPADYHLRRVELRNSRRRGDRPVRCRRRHGHPSLVERPRAGELVHRGVQAVQRRRRERQLRLGQPRCATPTTGRSSQHFVCRLGPLPLTEGRYAFSFTVRVWNKERWDYWDKAIGFTIGRCDLVQHRARHLQRARRRFRDPAGMAGRKLNTDLDRRATRSR